MKEIKAILKAYNSIDFSKSKAALATVVRVEGSSYRRTGARMLVLDNGDYLGGISGGCLEGDALRRAQKAIIHNKPSVVTYDTSQEDDHQIGVGLGCNGIIDILFTPIDPEDDRNMIRLLAEVADTRIPRIIITITECNIQQEILGNAYLYENDENFMKCFPVSEIISSVLQDITYSLSTETSNTITYKPVSITVFIEVIMPETHLIVYGSNYDIYPMVRIARELGWMVTVVTNTSKADKSLFSAATAVIHHKAKDEPLTDPYTAIVLMAHDYNSDFDNLQKVLKTKALYIGLLGPRKRSQKMFDALADQKNPVSDEDMKRIFAPAGLDIGASTPEEIALSIAAEIRSHFTNREGLSLRLREGTIYGN